MAPRQPELTFDVETTADTVIVRCHGALTVTSADRFRHEIKPLLLQARVVTIDFTDLARIDSVGLGTMVALYVSAQNAGRDLHIVNIGPRIREIFRITRLISFFESTGEDDSSKSF